MADEGFKTILLRYLRTGREAMIWKLEGLSEREARLPRTPTGTNLAGIVKHCLNVEYGYFGPTFGREIDDPTGLVPFEEFEIDPQVDFFLTVDESVPELIALYRRVGQFCDETIESLDLDAPGKVPWWGTNGDVTLYRILVHVGTELYRHAGHADILREQIDGAVGHNANDSNVPSDEDVDWSAYLDKLTLLANEASD